MNPKTHPKNISEEEDTAERKLDEIRDMYTAYTHKPLRARVKKYDPIKTNRSE